MSAVNTGWCRTLGNFATDRRAAHAIAQRISSPYPQRHTSMAFKSPRLPNPNVALLDRRQRAIARVLRSVDARLTCAGVAPLAHDRTANGMHDADPDGRLDRKVTARAGGA